MIIEATFIGQNSPYGYIRGVLYKLEISYNSYNNIIIQRLGENPSGMCTYSTLTEMLKSWRNLEAINYEA